MNHNSQFYSQLPRLKGELDQVIKKTSLYKDVPGNWTVIVTDIENSTIAVGEGKQQTVNLAATGSIVACLNIARSQQIDVPFFFGGDGATLIVPPQIIDECMDVLQQHSKRCRERFDFHLRVGSRLVSDLKAKGAILKIFKFERNRLHTMPIIYGDGLQLAESEIKSEKSLEKDLRSLHILNLGGMECKWDKVKPPRKTNEVVSLIITPVDTLSQPKINSRVLQKLREIYGDDEARNPLKVSHLNMVNKLDQIKNEVKMKYNKVTGRSIASSYGRTMVGKFYLKYAPGGKRYVKDLIQLTETLLIDGSINTVVSGTQGQREELIKFLNSLEQKNLIHYGFYKSDSSVLSCFVTALDDYHIHFLDGDNGGYTNAANLLKRKLRKQEA
ncbi:MAG: DUF3095 family protein [Nonlabens sp.]